MKQKKKFILHQLISFFFLYTFPQGGEGGSSAQLGLPNLGGVFIVLTGGMIVSCFIAVLEFMWENRKMAADPTVST